MASRHPSLLLHHRWKRETLRAGTDHKHRDPRTSGDPMISKDLMSCLKDEDL